mmetsp:Transcript_10310/g.15759  ORF Transcript_10310/g.15759 Transcript_10310/m.15759 type:complete len:82 (+) Transcript_10310:870-1115(+)
MVTAVTLAFASIAILFGQFRAIDSYHFFDLEKGEYELISDCKEGELVDESAVALENFEYNGVSLLWFGLYFGLIYRGNSGI